MNGRYLVVILALLFLPHLINGQQPLKYRLKTIDSTSLKLYYIFKLERKNVVYNVLSEKVKHQHTTRMVQGCKYKVKIIPINGFDSGDGLKISPGGRGYVVDSTNLLKAGETFYSSPDIDSFFTK